MSIFRSNRDLITFKAAYGHLAKEGAVDPSGYCKLADVQDLLVQKPKSTQSSWSFTGDWRKSVSRYFNA
jgi:hypothetical protein